MQADRSENKGAHIHGLVVRQTTTAHVLGVDGISQACQSFRRSAVGHRHFIADESLVLLGFLQFLLMAYPILNEHISREIGYGVAGPDSGTSKVRAVRPIERASLPF